MDKYLIALFLFLTLFASPAAHAQLPNDASPKETFCDASASTKILILGTYHMDNPGQDAYNTEADDVLAPKRQREIAEVVEKLARFNPTKIAIEEAYRSRGWNDRYKQFLGGKYQLGRNEIEQIGFQLAKRLNHPQLYPVDFPMWMNGWTPGEIEAPKAKPSPQPSPQPSPAAPPAAAAAAALPAYIAKGDQILKTGTILEAYRYLNSDEYIEASHVPYMGHLLPPAESMYIYQRADLLTNWYKRNIRIMANVGRIAEFPNDRVLLVIGSGHLKILRDFAVDSPQLCFVNTDLYLK